MLGRIWSECFGFWIWIWIGLDGWCVDGIIGSNDLALVPPGTQPTYRIVEPKLIQMEKYIADLDTVIVKLASVIHPLITVCF